MAAFELPVQERLISKLLEIQVRNRRDAPFLTSGVRTLSFGETAEAARRIARGFTELGVKKGDRVGVMLPNDVDFVLNWFACAWIGAVCVPLNPTYKGYMLEYVIADAGIKGIVVHTDFLSSFRDLAGATLDSVVWFALVGDSSAAGLDRYSGKIVDYTWLTHQPPAPDAAGHDPRDPNYVVYTSGTTGPSKGVVLSSAALLAGSCTFIEIVDLQPNDKLFTPLPLFHGIASRQGVLPCLLIGAQIVIAPRFSASQFWEQVCKTEATIAHTMFGIPAMLKAQPPHALERKHKLRLMYNASHDRSFEDRFGVPLLEAYGLIETGITIYSPHGDLRRGSCGRIHRDWEALLVDENELPVSVGDAGELLLRPKAPWIMMDGYLNKPETTLHACRNLWFHTGDFLVQDADGYFAFAGRQKERIRRRGENISPWEIERIVYGHPDVGLCAALGHPAKIGDDDVRLVLTLKSGRVVSPEQLMDWLQERMPGFMLPRYIEILDDMPMTPTEKVQKSTLLEVGLTPTAWDREQAGYRLRAAESGAKQ